jgi:sigma-70-like protein
MCASPRPGTSASGRGYLPARPRPRVATGLPQNDALAGQKDMEHDRTGVVSAVDRKAGLRTRLADAYVRSAPGGIRLAYLLTGDRAIAEDLVQEAFVRFVGRLRFLRDPDAFEPYLRRTIVNLSKNHFRRRAVERGYLEREGRRIEDVSTDPDVATSDTLRSALLRLRSANARRSFSATSRTSQTPRSPKSSAAARPRSARSSPAVSRHFARLQR